MQTSAMKACFQIAECSLSYAKISNFPITSKHFVLFSLARIVFRKINLPSYCKKYVPFRKNVIKHPNIPWNFVIFLVKNLGIL